MAASRFQPLSSAALAAALAGSALLAGCGEHHAAPVETAAPPAERPDALAGAPVETPPPPADVSPPAPPPPAATPGAHDVVYDLGPVVAPHDTMAPIPNPPEPERAPRRVRNRYAMESRYGRETPAPHRIAPRSSHPHTLRTAAAPVRVAPQPRRTATAHVASAAHAPPLRPTAPPVASPAHEGPAPREATPIPAPHQAKAASAHAQVKPHTVKPGSAASADRGAHLAALQAALRTAVAHAAVLAAPELKPGQPADVTLTLPAAFAATVRDEAARQNLADHAASVNMTALLAGDGYAVAPDETQSQPLTVGQPTEFHWTVTAQPGARGALHADVGADLLGGGDEALQLGAVAPTSGGGLHVSPRAWGAALLVLLAVAVFTWLSRGGRSARRRPATTLGPRPDSRPLDVGRGPVRGDGDRPLG